MTFLHHVIAEYFPSRPELVAEGGREIDGWFYIIDARVPDPMGEVPPEGLVGGFQLDQGRLVPSSYWANPEHRIFFAKGFFQLQPRLDEALRTAIRGIRSPSG